MELLCPVCNGMERIEASCPRCGRAMEDGGAITGFFDEYSPYLDMGITRRVDGVPPDQCRHIFRCAACGAKEQITFNLIEY